MKFCVDCGLNVLIAQGIDEVVDGRLIEDLLGRDEVKINLKEIRNTDA